MRCTKSFLFVATIVCTLIVSPVVTSAADGETKPVAPLPKEQKVSVGPMRIEVELSGLFESLQMSEISIKPKSWSTLKVIKAVPHGTVVKPGDTLIQLDLKGIDEAIAALESSQATDKVSLQDAAATLKNLEQTTPLDLVAAQREHETTSEDLKRFLEVGRPMAEKSANFSLKSSANYLEYQLEELHQLEKMYNEDDLTEETEEIILKRARNNVDQYKFSFEQSKLRHEETLKTDLPRQQETRERATKTASLAWDKARVTLPLALQTQRLAFAKKERDYKKATEKLVTLHRDRRLLRAQAPVGGIVYYGRCVRGKWSSGSTVTQALRPGGTVTAGSTVMTIVNPKTLQVRATLPEKQLRHVRRSLSAAIVPTSYPDAVFAARIGNVSLVPISGSDFEIVAHLNSDKRSVHIVPGMTCKIKILVYDNKKTITVASSAVHRDATDAKTAYVLLRMSDGSFARSNVKTGHTSDKKTEIVDGLKLGDVVKL